MDLFLSPEIQVSPKFGQLFFYALFLAQDPVYIEALC